MGEDVFEGPVGLIGGAAGGRLDKAAGGSLPQSQLLAGPRSKLCLLDGNPASSFLWEMETSSWGDEKLHKHLEVPTAVRPFQLDSSGKGWLGSLPRPWERILGS